MGFWPRPSRKCRTSWPLSAPAVAAPSTGALSGPQTSEGVFRPQKKSGELKKLNKYSTSEKSKKNVLTLITRRILFLSKYIYANSIHVCLILLMFKSQPFPIQRKFGLCHVKGKIGLCHVKVNWAFAHVKE